MEKEKRKLCVSIFQYHGERQKESLCFSFFIFIFILSKSGVCLHQWKIFNFFSPQKKDVRRHGLFFFFHPYYFLLWWQFLHHNATQRGERYSRKTVVENGGMTFGIAEYKVLFFQTKINTFEIIYKFQDVVKGPTICKFTPSILFSIWMHLKFAREIRKKPVYFFCVLHFSVSGCWTTYLRKLALSGVTEGTDASFKLVTTPPARCLLHILRPPCFNIHPNVLKISTTK